MTLSYRIDQFLSKFNYSSLLRDHRVSIFSNSYYGILRANRNEQSLSLYIIYFIYIYIYFFSFFLFSSISNNNARPGRRICSTNTHAKRALDIIEPIKYQRKKRTILLHERLSKTHAALFQY